jgi:hypothetical protein
LRYEGRSNGTIYYELDDGITLRMAEPQAHEDKEGQGGFYPKKTAVPITKTKQDQIIKKEPDFKEEYDGPKPTYHHIATRQNPMTRKHKLRIQRQIKRGKRSPNGTKIEQG